MGPPTVSKANVKYPIFAATWAHNNPAVLIVGGGGGAGRSGVPNAIAAFDTGSRAPNLDPFAELELSRDEDSVTCLASLSTRDGCIVYAGVNSSENERLKANNQHLRAFNVKYPKKSNNKEQPGKIGFLSKTQLFSSPTTENAKKEGYQRLVRLSHPGEPGRKRLGVLASSLADKDQEIVVFAAVSNKPEPSDIIQRVKLGEKEPNDVDIIEHDVKFRLAYALDYSVYMLDVKSDLDKRGSKRGAESPRKAYEVPFPDGFESKTRPKIRCIRWLSPSHLLLLVNKHNRSGVELMVLRMYDDVAMGSITIREKLPRHVKQAVDMDSVRLDAEENGAYQIGVAVASIDQSLHILTIDYRGTAENSLSGFSGLAVYENAHEVSMTKVAWSPFLPPSSQGSARLRLASTSLQGSISVETFTLSKSGSRFLLSDSRWRKVNKTIKYLIGALIALCLALLIQSLIDPAGDYTRGILPASLQNVARGYKAPGAIVDDARRARAAMDGADIPVAKATRRIRDLLHLQRPRENRDAPKKALVIHHDPDTESSLSTEVHADSEEVVKRHTEAKTWEELSQAERKRWKDKLVDAGMWAVEEGETILKGIFFSEAAGVVGQVARGIING